MIRKFRRNFGTIAMVGGGLGIGLAIENKLNPSIPVFEKVAPVVAPIGTIIGAGMVLDSVKMLDNAGRRQRKKPMF